MRPRSYALERRPGGLCRRGGRDRTARRSRASPSAAAHSPRRWRDRCSRRTDRRCLRGTVRLMWWDAFGCTALIVRPFAFSCSCLGGFRLQARPEPNHLSFISRRKTGLIPNPAASPITASMPQLGHNAVHSPCARLLSVQCSMALAVNTLSQWKQPQRRLLFELRAIVDGVALGPFEFLPVHHSPRGNRCDSSRMLRSMWLRM